MNYDQILVFGGWALTLTCGALILVPYLQGRRDLFLPSNFFLAGSALFIGVSAVRAGTEPHLADYSDSTFAKLVFGFILFYGTMLIVYLRWKFPRRLAGRIMRNWPAGTASSMLILSIITTIFAGLALFPIPITFVRQLSFHIFVHCGPFALVFALAAFHRDRTNPFCLMNLIAVAAITLILSMSFGGGRRLLVGAVMTVPIYAYWAWFRYYSRVRVIGFLGVMVVLGVVYLDGYNKIRGRESEVGGVQRAVESAKFAVEKAKEVASTDLFRVAQPSVETALLTIHAFTGPQRVLEGAWFHGLFTILVNPIPREFWEDKPLGLSSRVPQIGKEYFGLRGYGAPTWSINCVAQGYHDGGPIPIFVYAVMAAFSLRFFDELMIRQPDNPFLIGMLAASCGHITGFARGSMDVMSWQLIGCVLSLLFLKVLGHMLFGARVGYPRTDHLLTYPSLGAMSEWMRQRRTTGR